MEFISEAMHAAIDLGRPAVSHDVSTASSTYSATTTIYNHGSHQDQQQQQQQPHQHQQLNTNVMIYYRGFADGDNPPASQHSTVYPTGQDHAYQEMGSRSAMAEALASNGNAGGGHFENGANSLRLLSLAENLPEGSTSAGGTGLVPPYPIYLSDPSQYSTVLAAHQQPLHHHGHDVSYHHPSTYLQAHSLAHQHQDQLDFSSFAHQAYPTTIAQPHNQQTSESCVINKNVLNSPEIIIPDSISNIRKRTHSNTSETASEGPHEIAADPLPACSVCNDISSGVHYGVWACEGCKGFFRRAMSRKPNEPPFACYYALNCDVNRENRNKCRACRLRRCQEAGMVYGGSKEGKRRRNSISSTSHPTTEFHMPIELQWKEYVLAAHTATFTPVSEIFMSRFASVISLGAADLWPNGSDIGKRGCQTIQLFAAALPFFGCLPNDLRSRLIEMNSLDLMILRVAYRFCPERDAFLFPPGTEVTVNCLSSTHLGPVISNRLSTLGRAMIRLGVGTDELAFLSTLALLSTDNIIICDNAHANILREIENNVLKAFQAYMSQRWVSRPTLVGKLLMLLLDVRMIQYSAPISVWLEPNHPPQPTQSVSN